MSINGYAGFSGGGFGAKGGFGTGPKGEDGFSPVVAITDITGGHRLAITDKNGVHACDIENGAKGDTGDDGDDGFSPTVTVTAITGGHTVTVTDAEGEHSFNVMDGADGVYWCTYGTTTGAEINAAITAGKLPGVQISETDELGAVTMKECLLASRRTETGGGIVNFQFLSIDGNSVLAFANSDTTTWSTPSTQTLFAKQSWVQTYYRTAADQNTIDDGKQATISDLATIRSGAASGATAYQKPSGGIPDSDLAAAHYTEAEADALLADKAASVHTHTKSQITDFPETVITKISAGTGLVSNTSSGEAEVALSSESQASLAKADTALQSVPSTYRTSAAQDTIDATKADLTLLTGAWTANTEYKVHSLCVYNQVLYSCTEKHTSGSTFDSTKWAATTMGGLLDGRGVYYIPYNGTVTDGEWFLLTRNTGNFPYGSPKAVNDIVITRSGYIGICDLVQEMSGYTNLRFKGVVPWSGKQDKPTAETYTIASASWTALASSSPFTYSATVTATHTIGSDTVCKLINDNAVSFATYGFAIGSVSGQSVTIYSIGQPSASVTLEVDYYG